MNQEQLNYLRRLAGVEEITQSRVDESVGVQYAGVGGTTSSPDNHPVPQGADMKIALQHYENEEDREDDDHHSVGEMARKQLHSICRNGEALLEMIKDDDNLEGWVASKLTKAEDYLDAIADYLRGPRDEDEHVDEGQKSDMLRKIDQLKAQKIQTAGHGRRARIDAQIKELESKVAALNEVDTSHTFKKGDHVKVDGKKMVVVVPDAKANFIGVVPPGKEDDKDAVDLVRVSKVTLMERHDDVTEFSSYQNWAHAVKKVYQNMGDGPVEIVGDKSKASATIKSRGKRLPVGSWDGSKGKVLHGVVYEQNLARQIGLERTDDSAGMMPPKYRRVAEGAEIKTYSGWRRATKQKHGNVEFEGDKDICQAFVVKNGKRVGVGEWDGAVGEVYESMHYHTDGAYPMSHADSENNKPINVSTSYDTTANAPEFDSKQDNEDHELANDTTPITVPATILSDLKAVIDECMETAEKAKRRDDHERVGYYEDTARAMQIVHDYLSMRTVEGLKRAQLMSQRMLNVSRALMPTTVWKFLADGGKKRSLKDYHIEVKNMPIVGPRNTLNNND
jgi:hypothetical protein